MRLIDFKNANSLTYKGMEADLNKEWSYTCIQKYANNTLTIPANFIERMYEVYGVHIDEEFGKFDELKNQYAALEDMYNKLLKENESLRKFNVKVCTEVVTDKAFKYILQESSYQGKFNEEIYLKRRKYYEELMFGHEVTESLPTPYDFEEKENTLLKLTCEKCSHYHTPKCRDMRNIIQECKCRQLANDLLDDTDLVDEAYYNAEDVLTKDVSCGQYKTLKELKLAHQDIFDVEEEY